MNIQHNKRLTQAERVQLNREFGVSMNDEGLDAKTLTPATFSYKEATRLVANNIITH